MHERTSTAAQDEDTLHRADEAAAAAAVAAAAGGGGANGGGAGATAREWAALVTRHGEKRLLHAVADELRGASPQSDRGGVSAIGSLAESKKV